MKKAGKVWQNINKQKDITSTAVDLETKCLGEATLRLDVSQGNSEKLSP
jgi:hypothetical protein